MQSGHSWKYRCKNNLGTTWFRGMLHWTRYVALQVSPDICDSNNSGKGWRYSRVLTPSHQYAIHIFIGSIRSGYSRLNRVTTISKSWGSICKNWRNTVGSPKTTGNPISSSPLKTWCTSKGGTDRKAAITTKGGHSCTAKGGKGDECTRSKGGYTSNIFTHPTVSSHIKVQGQRE